MTPRAPEIVEFQSQRLTVQADLEAYGLMGITKGSGDSMLQLAIELVGRTEQAETFLRSFEALSKKGTGVVHVTKDERRTKIAIYSICSSVEAKKALDGAGGDL